MKINNIDLYVIEIHFQPTKYHLKIKKKKIVNILALIIYKIMI